MVWHQPDPSEEYEYRYYPSGRLRTYRHSTLDNPTTRQRVSTIVEVFDESGALQGVKWEQVNKGSMYWWEGQPVKSLEWVQKRKTLGWP